MLTGYGIATEEEIDLDTFDERIEVELGTDPILVSGPSLAVWGRKP